MVSDYLRSLVSGLGFYRCLLVKAVCVFLGFSLPFAPKASASINATLEANGVPDIAVQARWGSLPFDIKFVEDVASNLHNFYHELIAFSGDDGGSCSASASVSLDVDPQPDHKRRLSFEVTATVGARSDNAALSNTYAAVRFRIRISVSEDTRIEGLGEAPFSGGIRLLNGATMQLVPTSSDGTVLGPGDYVLDLAAEEWQPTQLGTGKRYSARLAFATVQFPDGYPPPPPPPPAPLPLPDEGAVVYHGVPSAGYLYGAYDDPYAYANNYGIAIGDWWTAGLSGQPWSGYSYYQPYGYDMNGNWTFLTPDHQMSASPEPSLLSVNLDEPLYINAYTQTGLSIRASYGASGQFQTGNNSQGFLIAIGAAESVKVRYTTIPNYPANIVSSFEMPLTGDYVTLERGTHYFGVIARYWNFPADPTWPYYNNPPSGGGDEVEIEISLTSKSPPKISEFSRSGRNFTLQWSDAFDRAVHVQRRTSLSTGSWQIIGSNVTTKVFTDTNAPSESAFYRLFVPAQ